MFNLISCDDFLINAKFIPDSKRADVTWMGSIGVVMSKPLYYRGSKVTHFKFDAEARTVHIGNVISLDAKAVKGIASENGSINIAEEISDTHHPAVNFDLKETGLHFTIKYDGEHLDIFWQHGFKDGHSHGLIGEATIYTY